MKYAIFTFLFSFCTNSIATEDIRVPSKNLNRFDLEECSNAKNAKCFGTVTDKFSKICAAIHFSSDTGFTYTGSLHNEKIHGFGAYVCNHGGVYEGEFVDGVATGEGIVLFPSNSDKKYYKGGFKNNSLYGEGTLVMANGDERSGFFENNYIVGKGSAVFSDGAVYEGNFQRGKFQGKGIFTYADGARYEGEFLDGAKHGYGVEIYTDGAKYNGNFENNLPHGFGKYETEEGMSYEGNYVKGTWTGKGNLTLPNGLKYSGQFKYGQSHGKGSAVFPDGATYSGEYKRNKIDGKGIYKDRFGNVWSGNFKNNLLNGKGKTVIDGNISEGTFINGNLQGKAKQIIFISIEKQGVTSKEKCIYEGNFESGVREGHGIQTCSNGSIYKGFWKDDNYNGKGTLTFADGNKKSGIWEKGLLVKKQIVSTSDNTKTTNLNDEIKLANYGTGFSISADGLILTNHHVIEGCEKVRVNVLRRSYKADVIKVDTEKDIALLSTKVTFKNPMRMYPLEPILTQPVYVAGFPFGKSVKTVKVTKGIISSLSGENENELNMQIDAAVQAGNSGGPVLDDFGNVVGMVKSKADYKKIMEAYGDLPENVNFAIKSSTLMEFTSDYKIIVPSSNTKQLTMRERSKQITDNTHQISCWMTNAQIEKMVTKKVFATELSR